MDPFVTAGLYLQAKAYAAFLSTHTYFNDVVAGADLEYDHVYNDLLECIKLGKSEWENLLDERCRLTNEKSKIAQVQPALEKEKHEGMAELWQASRLVSLYRKRKKIDELLENPGERGAILVREMKEQEQLIEDMKRREEEYMQALKKQEQLQNVVEQSRLISRASAGQGDIAPLLCDRRISHDIPPDIPDTLFESDFSISTIAVLRTAMLRMYKGFNRQWICLGRLKSARQLHGPLRLELLISNLRRISSRVFPFMPSYLMRQ